MIRKNTPPTPRTKAVTQRKTPAAPGRKGLDRTQVLQVARDLSNRSGVEQLSIKALAEQLGIRPPSVYAHFQGLPEVRRELALWGHRALAESLRRSAVGRSGGAALLACGKAYLEFIRREPGLYSATVPPPGPDDAELREAADEWLSVLLQILASVGLAPDNQVHALRGIRSIVHGFGHLEANGAFRTTLDRDLSFDQVLQTFVEAVSRPAASRTRRAAGAGR